ncbi:asparagine synthase (glutamine-hydrolyzing) [Candidatus Pacearchaeota archaeon]|nr:asparagine synthase (glutamine-hydrolyzing) [Candidatus Pacearchaeota archaeon]
MCGILGFNWEEPSLLKKGLQAIEHRGPDAIGTYLSRGMSLGHRRLSIIDLSRAGKQPMTNEKGDVWIVFNGEIYNFKELKDNLKGNHSFHSGTDTELLIHLYEEEGTKMVNKLEGMFAFCIYDERKKILFLARDKAGIKPLYYHKFGKRFIFSSEIKAILEDNIDRKVNLSALNTYLMFRANTSHETFFKDIFKLEAGTYAVYDLKINSLNISKYWDYKPKPSDLTFQDSVKELRGLLEESVRGQLMSDVPYGMYLSGGIDSGTIASLVRKYATQKLRSFSVGFAEEEHSEVKEARYLAENIGSEHRELILDSSSVKHMPDVIVQGDEPMADPTALPVYLLSKMAKKHCTVILTGEGADELFGGYPQYRFMQLHQKILSPLPDTIRKAGVGFVKSLPLPVLKKGFSFASALGQKGKERFGKFAHAKTFAERYLQQVAIINEEEQKELLNKDINIYETYQQRYFMDTGSKNLIGSCQRIDFKESMVDDLLMKLDKNTMAFSIEGRVPFLDGRIMDLSARISDEFKMSGGKNKLILRTAVKDLLPKKTLQRKKRHFFVPIDDWLQKEFIGLREDLLSRSFLEKQGIFNPASANKMISGLRDSRLYYSRQLWSLLVFQIWYKSYIQNEKIKT